MSEVCCARTAYGEAAAVHAPYQPVDCSAPGCSSFQNGFFSNSKVSGVAFTHGSDVVIRRPPTCLSSARHFARDGHALFAETNGSAARAPGAMKAAAAAAAVVPRTVRREISLMKAH